MPTSHETQIGMSLDPGISPLRSSDRSQTTSHAPPTPERQARRVGRHGLSDFHESHLGLQDPVLHRAPASLRTAETAEPPYLRRACHSERQRGTARQRVASGADERGGRCTSTHKAQLSVRDSVVHGWLGPSLTAARCCPPWCSQLWSLGVMAERSECPSSTSSEGASASALGKRKFRDEPSSVAKPGVARGAVMHPPSRRLICAREAAHA